VLGADQIRDCELRLAADSGQLGVAFGREEGQHGPEIGEVDQRQTLLVGVAKEQGQALLLGLVRLQAL
jgi:hypothetical protein